jgi:hypothetical protein
MRKSMYSEQTCGVGLRLVATRCLRGIGIWMLYLVKFAENESVSLGQCY